MDDVVDELYTAVKLYLTQISREALDEREGRRWADIVSFTINLEQVGDIIERVLTGHRGQEDRQATAASPTPAWRRSATCTRACVANLRLGMSVFLQRRPARARRSCSRRRCCSATSSARTPTRTSAASPATRCESIETSSLHLDLISRPEAHQLAHLLDRLSDPRGSRRARAHASQGARAAARRRSGAAGARTGKARLAEAQAPHGLKTAPWRSRSPTSASCSPARAAARYDGEPVTQLEHALQTRRARRGRPARRPRSSRPRCCTTSATCSTTRARRRRCAASTTCTSTPRCRSCATCSATTCSAPIKLHVDAKRYLCATRAGYFDALSTDSKRSLALQGGVFTPAEAAAFIAQPYAARRRRGAAVGRPRQARRRRSRRRSPTTCRSWKRRSAPFPPRPRDGRPRRLDRLPAVELTLGVTLAVLGAGLLHASLERAAQVGRRRRSAARHGDRRRGLDRVRARRCCRSCRCPLAAAWPFVAGVRRHPLRLLHDARAGVPDRRPVVRVSADARHRAAARHGARHRCSCANCRPRRSSLGIVLICAGIVGIAFAQRAPPSARRRLLGARQRRDHRRLHAGRRRRRARVRQRARVRAVADVPRRRRCSSSGSRGAAARGPRALRARAAGGAACSAAFCSVAAYGIVLWAMTRAPVAAVAALRETSVLFAALIGAVLAEGRLRRRAAGRRGERRRGRRGAQALSDSTASIPA